jgi:glycosyltransferase involved in cell wall biosynthesis
MPIHTGAPVSASPSAGPSVAPAAVPDTAPVRDAAGQPLAARPRIAMVVTRDIAADATPSGRHRTVRHVAAALGEHGAVTPVRLHHLLERRRVSDMLRAGLTFALSLLKGRPLPLQCLLFATASARREVAARIAADPPEVLYLDGVRLHLLLKDLRPHLTRTRVVVDFDDLMSRRMALLRDLRLPLSLGYVRGQVPGPLRRLLESRALGALVTAYEAAALRRVEGEMLASSDAAVLVSSADARALADAQADPRLSARIHAIPPPAEVPGPLGRLAPSLRFVFIGTDRQMQNRLTIDRLVDLWRRLRPAAELHVFGPQTRARPAPDVPGVVLRGWVEHLGDVYDGHSVLLAPAVLGGGVKTKVIEALAHGCPAAGNAVTFEGLSIPDYPLCLDDAGIEALVMDPEAHLETLRAAARTGFAYVRRELSAERYRARWREVLAPGTGATRPALKMEAVR